MAFESQSRVKALIIKLKSKTEMSEDEAFSIANGIAEELSNIAHEEMDRGNYIKAKDLFEQAANAYLLASEKVPLDKREKVAFPANYWEMSAARLGSQVSKVAVDPETSRKANALIASYLHEAAPKIIFNILKGE